MSVRKQVKKLVKDKPWLKDLIYRWLLIGRMIRDRWFMSRRARHDAFTRECEGYYESSPLELERYARVMELVEHHRGQHSERAFELGCSDGVFTSRLAVRCSNVVAWDLSQMACDFARDRCREFSNVEISQVDITQQDSLGGSFDLIVAMDVLELIPKAQLPKVVSLMESALAPGGLIAVTDCRIPSVIRGRWWARWIAEDGERVPANFASRPSLKLLHNEFHPLSGEDVLPSYYAHVITFFERKGE